MTSMHDEQQETIWRRLVNRLRGYAVNDLKIKLLALLIVGVIWFSVAGQTSPSTPITISNVDVMLDNPPPQFAVTSSSPSQVKLKVQGPEDVLRELRIAASTRSGDLVAYADLSTFREGGVQIAQLKVRGLPDEVNLREIEPATVRVTLDPIDTKRVDVEPRLIGSVPDGYKLTSAYVEPESVVLRGPKNLLETIEEVATTTVSLNNRTESFSRPVEVDVTGSDIAVEGSVVLHVRIEEDYGTKEFTVPISQSGDGQVEPGTVTVTLRGPFPALNQIRPSDITAIVQPQGESRRQSLAPQIEVSGPAAPRVEVESVSPQQVVWRR